MVRKRIAEKESEQHKKWYQKNREKRKQAIRNRQKEIMKYVQDIKMSMGCVKCGYKKCARALTFHHTSDDKRHDISRMCAQGRSLEKIMLEIQKCICVCSNCHLEIHDESS